MKPASTHSSLLSKYFNKILSFVEVSDPDKCWEWTGVRGNDGYGRHWNLRAHRLVWFIVTGEDPGDRFVCHGCDNRACCNPNHLFLGTHTDNMRDASQKGRLRGFAQKGTSHWRYKITDEEVVEIRNLALLGEMTQKQIAARFGVSPATVSKIKKGKRRL